MWPFAFWGFCECAEVDRRYVKQCKDSFSLMRYYNVLWFDISCISYTNSELRTFVHNWSSNTCKCNKHVQNTADVHFDRNDTFTVWTRMHSSMHTSCSFTICQSLLPVGVSAPEGGVSAPRGRCLLLGGCVWSRGCLLLRGRGCVSAAGGCLLWGVSAAGGCLLPVSVCSREGVCSSGGLLLGGVCSWGVSVPGGCLLLGGCLLPGGVCSQGCLLWGVSAPGGVCSWGICSQGGVVSQHALRQTAPCEQNDRQV